ncbi:MAG: hypothetical protein A2538_02850 [Candidatus Magasanikbacteria bacterium RIFOXYD2_FULL_41_14]|uniref:Uncharacterized protein n=1 Tax=Candidatus Magasanikbacteria bacterium RIFOXYD2_FULL_41_14 TaxID=1798709 RepID=A0A1F6PCU4_9BACT|nr:MAG: hypothetical protein A2538_02850 [Candidatus Magasanikbacteria bacterium RIFOXYD2_FULL_41_14]
MEFQRFRVDYGNLLFLSTATFILIYIHMQPDQLLTQEGLDKFSVYIPAKKLLLQVHSDAKKLLMP